jgi:mRNA interferase MazF
VFLVRLDPTVGSEINKTRPCVVVSPDELNGLLSTLIVVPLSTRGKAHPFRVQCEFDRKEGLVMLDQLRTVDKRRLIRKLGVLDKATQTLVLKALAAVFAE